MKTVSYSIAAIKSGKKLSAEAREQVIKAIKRYAETGAGNVIAMKGQDGARLRSGDYRAIFIETETEITVLKMGHRKDVYD